MKLTKQAIDSIDSREKRFQLALALGFTEIWVEKLLLRNKSNGPLTTVTALNVIREQSGLSDEQILESEVVEQN